MTYGCVAQLSHLEALEGAGVSHSAELVRGDCSGGEEGPLIRPFGPPSPQGEKGFRVFGHAEPRYLPNLDGSGLRLPAKAFDSSLLSSLSR